jgi:hypothetical protein
MNKIKNWFWTAVLGFGAILDFANDLLPEALKYFSFDEKYANYIRFGFFVFTLIKLKKEMPSQNVSKLFDKVAQKAEKENNQ